MNQSTGCGFAGCIGRLNPPAGRGVLGDVRVPLVLAPITGTAFIESAIRLRGKSTSVTVTVTRWATFTTSDGNGRITG